MFEYETRSKNRETNYQRLLEVLPHYLNSDDSLITNLANVSALINFYVDKINWVGFYLYNGKLLTLGPFQGLPACTQIALGRGVCGSAAKTRKTQVVADVTVLKNHITCDGASLSEIVVPIIKDDQLIGVLDIDSPIKNRFDERDQKTFEAVVAAIVDKSL